MAIADGVPRTAEATEGPGLVIRPAENGANDRAYSTKTQNGPPGPVCARRLQWSAGQVFSIMRAPLRRVIPAPGQRLTAASKVARARTIVHASEMLVKVRAGGLVPAVDRMGVVRHEPYS
jgi:hypothetical protein